LNVQIRSTPVRHYGGEKLQIEDGSAAHGVSAQEVEPA
jgi:hypothetical protein